MLRIYFIDKMSFIIFGVMPFKIRRIVKYKSAPVGIKKNIFWIGIVYISQDMTMAAAKYFFVFLKDGNMPEYL